MNQNPRGELVRKMHDRQQASYRKEKTVLAFLVAVWLLGVALTLSLIGAVIYVLIQVGQAL